MDYKYALIIYGKNSMFTFRREFYYLIKIKRYYESSYLPKLITGYVLNGTKLDEEIEESFCLYDRVIFSNSIEELKEKMMVELL